jgi:sec-independent protein translocase protein TatA
MSSGEIILILFVYLMLFGAKGVPALAQTLGKAVYQFRNAAKDVQSEIMQSANEFRKEAESTVRLDQLGLDLDEAPKQATPAPPAPLPQDIPPTSTSEGTPESK